MDRHRFIRHVAHLFRGQVLYALSQWIVLAILARLWRRTGIRQVRVDAGHIRTCVHAVRFKFACHS